MLLRTSQIFAYIEIRFVPVLFSRLVLSPFFVFTLPQLTPTYLDPHPQGLSVSFLRFTDGYVAIRVAHC